MRHISQEAPTHPKDQYEAIVGRLGAMADRDGRETGAPSNVAQFTVCAPRGFGLRKITLSTGTYKKEMESCLHRQVRRERDRRWREKLRIPSTNRISKSASSGLFCNVVS